MHGSTEVFATDTHIKNREGLQLFCRVAGSGRPVLLIHGSLVDADFFEDTAAYLKRRYKVITYDRRSYSRSGKAEDCGLQAQAADAWDVLKALADEPVIVVGCSAGALIAMKLAVDHPEAVATLILHEPALLCYRDKTAPEEAPWEEIQALIAAGKYSQALMSFLVLNNSKEDPRAKPYPLEKADQHMQNGRVFVRQELRQMLLLEEDAFEIEKLRQQKNIFCLAGDSSGTQYAARAAGILAKRLERPLFYIPGGHNAARDLPAEFAASVAGLTMLCAAGEGI